MTSWDFMDDLLMKSNEVYEKLKKEAEEATFLATLNAPKSLKLGSDGMPVDVPKKIIRADPADDTGLYSGKGHTTCPYTPCDHCGSARGDLPGAYKVMIDGALMIKIVCSACVTIFRKSGSERPADAFGKNPEAIMYAERLLQAKVENGLAVKREDETGNQEGQGSESKARKKRKIKESE